MIICKKISTLLIHWTKRKPQNPQTSTCKLNSKAQVHSQEDAGFMRDKIFKYFSRKKENKFKILLVIKVSQ